jgi:prepilin-type N-terminal cleavage/methylation domain-containing protein
VTYLKIKWINKGFSLVEVLVSLCILSIGLSSLLKMQIYLIDDYQESRLLVDATHILSDVQLNEIYKNNSQLEIVEKVQENFPEGHFYRKMLIGYEYDELAWKLPRRPVYHVRF